MLIELVKQQLYSHEGECYVTTCKGKLYTSAANNRKTSLKSLPLRKNTLCHIATNMNKCRRLPLETPSLFHRVCGLSPYEGFWIHHVEGLISSWRAFFGLAFTKMSAGAFGYKGNLIYFDYVTVNTI